VTVTCPSGHTSDDADYCSVCGVKIDGNGAPAATPAPVAPVTDPSDPPASGETCPNCASELEAGSRFCEVCGYDPSTGSLPEAPTAQPIAATNGNGTTDTGSDPAAGAAGTGTAAEADAAAGAGPAGTAGSTAAGTGTAAEADAAAGAGPAGAGAGAGTAAGAGAGTAAGAGAGVAGSAGVGVAGGTAAGADAGAAAGTWVAVVTADRPYYDRNQVSEVQFPLGVPARTIELDGANPQAIGRRSRSRGTSPAIDLAGPPEDAAVSHTHASLLPTTTGGWELVDHGSTNGTYLNESPHPIGANEPIPIAPGDRIYVGAWTKITLELRPET
jgi:hypothetical protein